MTAFFIETSRIKGPATAYIGFNRTADSPYAGNIVRRGEITGARVLAIP